MNHGKLRLRYLLVLFVVAVLISAARAQNPTPSPSHGGGSASIFTTYDPEILKASEWKLSRAWDVHSFQLDSRLLKRTVQYRVILPFDYYTDGSKLTRYPVIYLMHGLGGHFDNWTDKTSLVGYNSSYHFIIVTPEGGDGWYTDSATIPNDKYESYILQELIPEIDNKFRTLSDRSHRAIAGLSMGGYGAIKFGLKYPELFTLVGSFSGALNAPLMTKNSPIFYQSIPVVFGPEDSKPRAENDIFALLRALSVDGIASLPFIYLDCGTEDPFFATNRDFDALLLEKKVPHEFRELPGKHSWEYWNRQVAEFLRVADSKMNSPK